MLSLAPGEVPAPVEAFRLQARLVSIPAGLHILRYVSAKDQASPPVILVQPMPQDAAYVVLLSSHSSNSGSLVTPGDSVVMRALRDIRIVTTTASLGHLGQNQPSSRSNSSISKVSSQEFYGGDRQSRCHRRCGSRRQSSCVADSQYRTGAPMRGKKHLSGRLFADSDF